MKEKHETISYTPLEFDRLVVYVTLSCSLSYEVHINIEVDIPLRSLS